MAPTTITPLSNSQKLFLQRLLVAHTLTDGDLKKLYRSIRKTFSDVDVPGGDGGEDGTASGRDEAYMGTDLGHCLGLINDSLMPAFNLEIATVALPPPYDPEHAGGEPSDDDPPSARRRLVKYHSVVNRANDGVAKSYAAGPSRAGPHEMAYFRLVLERLVERGADGGGDGGSSQQQFVVGCPGSMKRMDLINLRTDLEGAHENKLGISETQAALDMLEGEKWLVQVKPPGEDSDDDDEDDDEDAGSRRKRKRSSAGDRRKSLKGTYYGIGPRTFMELGDFLKKSGFPEERMPQTILHSAK
ncbi:hypothetical protein THAOC_25033 [Thalassiosira oceanica]|uniref:Non-structural maintenance of chromosomes element 1 homolog n=1 Tax=Thalassiosira oceanica TaxID=159749 RepID=K0S946_THAOC|nr:hypothetical protein THAOC_25033 [Thalassiosira oceanica]|eukprot:EJK55252.1 hypothetical protein THAOC_25033 [Thalassiosira oceanica]